MMLSIFVSNATAAGKCVNYSNILHCAVGEATLGLNASKTALNVSNPSKDVDSGVSIETPNSTEWDSDVTIPLLEKDTIVKLASVSQGIATSLAEIKYTNRGVVFGAYFTASLTNRTYRVDVYRDGIHQGAMLHIPVGISGGGVQTYPALALTGNPFYDFLNKFIVLPSGACEWIYVFKDSADYEIHLKDGQILLGDEIRLTEEVDPSGAYPYTSFDRIVMLGNFPQLKILSASTK